MFVFTRGRSDRSRTFPSDGQARRRRAALVGRSLALLAVAGVAVAGCGSSSSGPGKLKATSGGKAVVKVAVVSNSNMVDIEKLTPEFEKLNPGIKVEYDTLNENNERSLIETDITTHANEFNAVMISNYETPIWAKNGWLVNLTPQLTRTRAMTSATCSSRSPTRSVQRRPVLGAVLRRVLDGLLPKEPVQGGRPDDADASDVEAGRRVCRQAEQPVQELAGICLRGQNGWGENLAALDTVINTAGGSWFNSSWKPQLTSPADEAAMNFYVNLVRKDGEPGASNDGFTECESALRRGQGRDVVRRDRRRGPDHDRLPKVGADTGYAYAPTGTPTGATGVPSGWLYTWSLSIPKGVPNEAAALKYIEWATGKSYIAYSGPKIGWANIDPGTRYSTYCAAAVQEGRGRVLGDHAVIDQSHRPNAPDRFERRGPVSAACSSSMSRGSSLSAPGVKPDLGGDRRHRVGKTGTADQSAGSHLNRPASRTIEVTASTDRPVSYNSHLEGFVPHGWSE